MGALLFDAAGRIHDDKHSSKYKYKKSVPVLITPINSEPRLWLQGTLCNSGASKTEKAVTCMPFAVCMPACQMAAASACMGMEVGVVPKRRQAAMGSELLDDQ